MGRGSAGQVDSEAYPSSGHLGKSAARGGELLSHPNAVGARVLPVLPVQHGVWRAPLEEKFGSLTPDNIIGVMLLNEEAWAKVISYVEVVLRHKKRAMNARSAINDA
ncbi:hypothetical protein KPH14_012592 [Odynerus spinipes]|uniref:Uncharacterized protein n=1 Tax=Odynerus spinipes TaxID=1348599 RepID=A0AAD9RE76_9HYME|nr:hypothetical protein KPH14_012592 [Odynerus spinipes]